MARSRYAIRLTKEFGAIEVFVVCTREKGSKGGVWLKMNIFTKNVKVRAKYWHLVLVGLLVDKYECTNQYQNQL